MRARTPAALGRYLDDLPGDALTNEAVEWVRRFHETVNALEEFPAEGRLPVTDDFTFEDRRSGGVNFGAIDGSGARSYMTSMWDVGGRRPQMSLQEVVAVRGDRLAAVVEIIDYGDGNGIEGLVCRATRVWRWREGITVMATSAEQLDIPDRHRGCRHRSASRRHSGDGCPMDPRGEAKVPG